MIAPNNSTIDCPAIGGLVIVKWETVLLLISSSIGLFTNTLNLVLLNKFDGLMQQCTKCLLINCALANLLRCVYVLASTGYLLTVIAGTEGYVSMPQWACLLKEISSYLATDGEAFFLLLVSLNLSIRIT